MYLINNERKNHFGIFFVEVSVREASSSYSRLIQTVRVIQKGREKTKKGCNVGYATNCEAAFSENYGESNKSCYCNKILWLYGTQVLLCF